MYEPKILNGYRLIYMPNHHKALNSKGYRGYVYEHVAIAEEMLGRELKDGEEIHHLDFNRSNNRYENLLILSTQMHTKLHKWLTSSGLDVKIRELPQKQLKYCPECGKLIQGDLIKCCSITCSKLQRLKNSKCPTKEELEYLHSFCNDSEIGRKYNVVSNTVKKWRIKLGII